MNSDLYRNEPQRTGSIYKILITNKLNPVSPETRSTAQRASPVKRNIKVILSGYLKI